MDNKHKIKVVQFVHWLEMLMGDYTQGECKTWFAIPDPLSENQSSAKKLQYLWHSTNDKTLFSAKAMGRSQHYGDMSPRNAEAVNFWRLATAYTYPL